MNCAKNPTNSDVIEYYKTVAVSTAHLTIEDVDALTDEALNNAEGRVAMRGPGFFIKVPYFQRDDNYSNALNDILAWAWKNGCDCVEFDRDAEIIDPWPTY